MQHQDGIKVIEIRDKHCPSVKIGARHRIILYCYEYVVVHAVSLVLLDLRVPLNYKRLVVIATISYDEVRALSYERVSNSLNDVIAIPCHTTIARTCTALRYRDDGTRPELLTS